jgi:hypothetical protein
MSSVDDEHRLDDPWTLGDAASAGLWQCPPFLCSLVLAHQKDTLQLVSKRDRGGPKTLGSPWAPREHPSPQTRLRQRRSSPCHARSSHCASGSPGQSPHHPSQNRCAVPCPSSVNTHRASTSSAPLLPHTSTSFSPWRRRKRPSRLVETLPRRKTHLLNLRTQQCPNGRQKSWRRSARSQAVP